MNLPPFIPKNWIAETHKEVKQEFKSLTGRQKVTVSKIVEKEHFLTEAEAQEYKARKFADYELVKYNVTIRQAEDKDFAEQRLQEIAKMLGEELENAIQSEANILCYDTYTFGRLDYTTPIKMEIDNILEIYTEELDTPESMGWVGSNGLP